MKELVVKKINKYDYVLTDNNKDYTKNIEFIDFKVDVGDVIFVPDSFINEINMFTFGPLLKDTNIEDTIKILHDGKEIFLTRYYG